jgi:hypothetical protein
MVYSIVTPVYRGNWIMSTLFCSGHRRKLGFWVISEEVGTSLIIAARYPEGTNRV